MEKIADTGVERKSSQLEGKTLFYGVCGSIGAVDAVRQIRELRRHGAKIVPIMTSEAMRFITPLSLEWAGESKVITELGPESEHLKEVHGIIICPATWNFLVEISTGLATNALNTIAAIQIARKKPVILVPTLNAEFLSHPLYEPTLSRLESFQNVFIYQRGQQEGRLKMPEPVELANCVLNQFK